MLYLRRSCIYGDWLTNQNVFAVTRVKNRFRLTEVLALPLNGMVRSSSISQCTGQHLGRTTNANVFSSFIKPSCCVGTHRATSNNISAESTVGINTIWDELNVCLYLHRHSLSIVLIQQGSKMQTTVHLVSGHDWVTNSSV